MKKLGLAALCLFAAVDTTRAASIVSGSVLFDSAPAGIFGGWTINFSSTDPAYKLNSVVISLGGANLFLDTQLPAPGATLWQDFNITGGGAPTGFTSISPGTTAARDGATSYTLNFSNFTSGKTFSYQLDVDNCNDLLSLSCSIVNGSEFAGATATFNFGGPDAGSFSRTAAFAAVPGGTDFDAQASFRAEVPEPTTWTLIGSALAGIGLIRRKRQA